MASSTSGGVEACTGSAAFVWTSDGVGDVAANAASWRDLVLGVKLTCFTVGVPGMLGKDLSVSASRLGKGRWVPFASLDGSFEYLGWARCRIDLTLPPNLDHDPSRLLILLSVFGGLRSDFVDADLARVGIIVVFRLLTLAERASDDFVGVVTALGRLGAGDLVGEVVVLVISM